MAKSRQAFGVGGKSRRQGLDRNGTPKAPVAGAVDLAHSARPERGLDFVRPNARACGKRHAGQPMISAISLGDPARAQI